MTDQAAGLGVEGVLEAAAMRTGGLEDVGGGHFLEGLGRLLESAATEGRLNEIGWMLARERATRHTVNRLQYVEDRGRYPEITAQRIVKPVFIIGMPRTGTTILHDILAQDPDSRAPMTWEVTFPSPPPEAATFETDPRIAACAAEIDEGRKRNPGFDAIHPAGAQLTQECVVLMADTMCTGLFHNAFRVPTYEDWVDGEADFGPVYDFHYQQLQHLQARHAKDRWVLKTGFHLWGLEHLLATYPDARIVFTHRDPVKSMTSYSSLTTIVRRIGSDDVDPVEVAADWIPRLRNVLLRGIEVRRAREYPDAIFYDMYFPDFIRDQFSQVEAIYEALELPLTGQAADRMRAFIDDNPPGKHGLHLYAPEDYGVDPATVRAEFAPYIEHFGLTPE